MWEGLCDPSPDFTCEEHRDLIWIAKSVYNCHQQIYFILKAWKRSHFTLLQAQSAPFPEAGKCVWGWEDIFPHACLRWQIQFNLPSCGIIVRKLSKWCTFIQAIILSESGCWTSQLFTARTKMKIKRWRQVGMRAGVWGVCVNYLVGLALNLRKWFLSEDSFGVA